MNLIHHIEEISVNYSSSSRRAIAEFVLQEKNHLHKYSIKEIAAKTCTSKSALVRFAQTLGFSGWKESIKEFMEEQRYQEAHYSDVDPNYPFHADSSNSDIINIICSLQVESLLDTADLLDEAPLQEAVELLEKQNHIILFGLSPNVFLAQLFCRKMMSIGKAMEVATDSDVKLRAKSLGTDDCAIIISYSGNIIDKAPLDILPALKKKQVPIIAITSSGNNLLRDEARYTFSISSRERLYSKISNFATETSILYILNVIFSSYFAKHYDENLQYKLETSRENEAMNRFSEHSDVREL